jgi:hypothetical protein
MSVSASDNGRLTARVVRVRNRCLAVLSARRSLPPPSGGDLAAMGDGVGLSEAWTRWERVHTPAAERPAVGVSPPTRPRWRSPRAMKVAAALSAALLGFGVGERWFPRTDAQASAAAPEQIWEPVNQSVVGTLNAKFVGASARELSSRLDLTPVEVATLILRSPRRRWAPMDGIQARSDSLLWIHGRLRGVSTFEVGGDVRVVRRGIAELHVIHLVVDGREIDPTSVSRILTVPTTSAAVTDRLRFEVPTFIAALNVTNGTIAVIPGVESSSRR